MLIASLSSYQSFCGQDYLAIKYRRSKAQFYQDQSQIRKVLNESSQFVSNNVVQIVKTDKKQNSGEQEYVSRYKHTFEEPSKKDPASLIKQNDYLRECLKDLNYFITQKVEKQKDKIFKKFNNHDQKPKKSESELIDEQQQLLEREYENNNFIYTQQEKELKQLDQMIQSISPNQQFDLMNKIEDLNDKIRNEQNEIKQQKIYNFHEGKYIEKQISLPRVVETQQNTQFEMIKLQQVNEKVKDMSQKKVDQMQEYAKKIAIVDKDYQEALKIEQGFQLPIDEKILKQFEKEKKKEAILESNLLILSRNIEREEKKYVIIQKDLLALQDHTDEKINAIELQITQLNADIQQLKEFAQGVGVLPPKFSQESQLENSPRTSQTETENQVNRKFIPMKEKKKSPSPRQSITKSTQKVETQSSTAQYSPKNKEQIQVPAQKVVNSDDDDVTYNKKDESNDKKITKHSVLKIINTQEDETNTINSNTNTKPPITKENQQNTLTQDAPVNGQKSSEEEKSKFLSHDNDNKHKDKDGNEQDEENLEDIEAEIERLEREEQEQKEKEKQQQKEKEEQQQKENDEQQKKEKEKKPASPPPLKQEQPQQTQQKESAIKLSSDTQTEVNNQVQKIIVPNKNRVSINDNQKNEHPVEEGQKQNTQSQLEPIQTKKNPKLEQLSQINYTHPNNSENKAANLSSSDHNKQHDQSDARKNQGSNIEPFHKVEDHNISKSANHTNSQQPPQQNITHSKQEDNHQNKNQVNNNQNQENQAQKSQPEKQEKEENNIWDDLSEM